MDFGQVLVDKSLYKLLSTNQNFLSNILSQTVQQVDSIDMEEWNIKRSFRLLNVRNFSDMWKIEKSDLEKTSR